VLGFTERAAGSGSHRGRLPDLGSRSHLFQSFTPRCYREHSGPQTEAPHKGRYLRGEDLFTGAFGLFERAPARRGVLCWGGATTFPTRGMARAGALVCDRLGESSGTLLP